MNNDINSVGKYMKSKEPLTAEQVRRRIKEEEFKKKGIVGDVEIVSEGFVPHNMKIDREKRIIGPAVFAVVLAAALGFGAKSAIDSKINSGSQEANTGIVQVDEGNEFEMSNLDEMYSSENLLYDEIIMDQDGIPFHLVVTKDGTCIFLTNSGPTSFMNGISATEYLQLRGVDVDDLMNEYAANQGKHK